MFIKSFFKYVLLKFESLQSPGKLYIIPTKSGLLFVLTALIIITIGTIYTNNSILILGFILLSLFLVHIFSTHFNLKGFKVTDLLIPSHFSKEIFHITVNCINEHNTKRFSLKLKLSLSDGREIFLSLPNINGSKNQCHRVACKLNIRGAFEVQKVTLFTSYPMGLFYTWSPMNFRAAFETYPKPHGESIYMDSSFSMTDSQSNILRNEGDFDNHKKYEISDTPSRIDWKVYARKRELVTKNFSSSNQSIYDLNIDDIKDGDIEDKLSQLALWVKEIHELKQSWNLALPPVYIESDQGQSHYINTLSSLAKYSHD